jgi:50S ribosomal protein L16 3-hydroxylase
MDIERPSALLGGLSPSQFMRRHWQKKPLLVRAAIPGFSPLVPRTALFGLAAREEVESRLVTRQGEAWQLRRGPMPRRALPPLAQPEWTLLVQGVDLHDARVQALLEQFRFVPDARLDDIMISYASDGGGVGPHVDSYDVFLLQAQGRRRWRIGRQRDLSLRDDLPLKILSRFEPEQEYVLEPGDMLYLPPQWAHDGIAEGECQTYSVGFKAPTRGELAHELLQRLGDDASEQVGESLYSDRGHSATASPGAVPQQLQQFARDAVAAVLKDGAALERALGEYLTEPKANVWFEAGAAPRRLRSVVLDARTRMMHDARHVFVNGESWRAGGQDARLMRKLADQRQLSTTDLAGASTAAVDLLKSWCEAGWLHERGSDHER